MAEAPGKARGRLRAGRMAKPLLGLALAALLVLGLLSALAMSGPPRNGAFLEDSRGLSQLARALEEQGVRVHSVASGPHAVDALTDPERSVFLVAGVERAYTPGEVQAIVAFAERGGTAFIADDFGFGDAVAGPFGISFDKRQLRDASFRGNQSLVNVNATLAGENYTLLMNVPASLSAPPGTELRVLAESGTDSYIDVNLDGVEDPGDVKGPLPVLLEVPRGQGRGFFASDPGLLTNDAFNDNGPFLRALFRALLPDGGEIAFDESRHGQGPLGAMLAALVGGTVQGTSEPAIALVAGIAALALAGAVYATAERPEDITFHASRLSLPAHPRGEGLARERLRRLAARVVATRANMTFEQLDEAQPAQLAALTPDPVVKSVLLDEPVREPPGEVLRRLGPAARGGEASRRGLP